MHRDSHNSLGSLVSSRVSLANCKPSHPSIHNMAGTSTWVDVVVPEDFFLYLLTFMTRSFIFCGCNGL